MQVEQKMLLFCKINDFVNNFWTKKIEENAKHHRISRVETRRNKCILTIICQYEHLTLGQVEWPDLMNDPGRHVHITWCVMTRQTQWHLAHVSNSILWRVIDVNVFVACDDLIYDDVLWPVRGSLASSCTWFTVELYLNRHGWPSFIMDVERQVERFTMGNICIYWVVTWPWEQGNSSIIKGNRH